MTTPRGLRNNNPGNIIKSGIDWAGEKTSFDESVFEVFDTAEHGLEALCKLLLSYQDRHGLNTIRGIINRWAPPVENDTGAYVGAVAAQTGIGADLPLDLHRVPATLAALCEAIVQHENGQQPYPVPMIFAAAKVALGLSVATVPAPAETIEAAPAPGLVLVPPGAPVPTPAPSPRPRREPEELLGIPAAELDLVVAQFKAGGATVKVTSQPDGRYTVRAEY